MIPASDIKVEFKRVPLPEPPLCAVCGYPVRGETCGTCADMARDDDERVRYEVGRFGGTMAYYRFTLERFTNKTAVEICKGYPAENLYLWGKAGTGKTHLATALLRAYPGEVVKPQAIFRAARGQTGDGEQSVIDSYIRLNNVVIDDLGVDKQTQFSFSILYEIIDGRYMWGKKGMIITSNLSLSELAIRLDDDRITSRLTEMCRVVEMTGADKRLEAKQ